MAPMHHVLAGGVCPVHVAPIRTVRVVLKEHVIAAIEVNGTVGIVHPVGGRQEVKLGAQRIIREARSGGIPKRVPSCQRGSSKPRLSKEAASGEWDHGVASLPMYRNLDAGERLDGDAGGWVAWWMCLLS